MDVVLPDLSKDPLKELTRENPFPSQMNKYRVEEISCRAVSCCTSYLLQRSSTSLLDWCFYAIVQFTRNEPLTSADMIHPWCGKETKFGYFWVYHSKQLLDTFGGSIGAGFANPRGTSEPPNTWGFGPCWLFRYSAAATTLRCSRFLSQETSNQNTLLLTVSDQKSTWNLILVERTSGVTVEAGLGVDLHVNGGS